MLKFLNKLKINTFLFAFDSHLTIFIESINNNKIYEVKRIY
jgi:hypothetical protein